MLDILPIFIFFISFDPLNVIVVLFIIRSLLSKYQHPLGIFLTEKNKKQPEFSKAPRFSEPTSREYPTQA